MKILKTFLTDILTLRSHQWKYFIDPYIGCSHQCLYCIYGGSPSFYKKVRVSKNYLNFLREDLKSLIKKQIIYVGATSDVYQPIEMKKKITRQTLKLLLKYKIPTVMITKSAEILRDIDLLVEFNRFNLILVQFTLLTINELKSSILERVVSSPKDRLYASKKLSERGIPVHFHVSPYIPYFYDKLELNDTVKAIRENGGKCIYTNTLGMRHCNKEHFLCALNEIKESYSFRIKTIYPILSKRRANVFSPYPKFVINDILKFKKICHKNKIDYVCEFIPQFTLVNLQNFERGIFQYGLPAVYQMMSYWNNRRKSVCWDEFREQFLLKYSAVDEEYLKMVKNFWDKKILFENTNIIPKEEGGEVFYIKTNTLKINKYKILHWA